MTCETVRAGDVTMIVCSPRRKPKRCACGAIADLLCDHPLGRGTCDAPICRRHAAEISSNRHHCPQHATQGELAL